MPGPLRHPCPGLEVLPEPLQAGPAAPRPLPQTFAGWRHGSRGAGLTEQRSAFSPLEPNTSHFGAEAGGTQPWPGLHGSLLNYSAPARPWPTPSAISWVTARQPPLLCTRSRPKAAAPEKQ